MHISLIGMSGVGKSFWSKRLEQVGFKRFGCDEFIGARLTSVLGRPDGTHMRMGEWMGSPFEPGYESREKQYLNCEIQVLLEIIEYVENSLKNEKIVIDTTGSVIYAGNSILESLKNLTTVIHLETSPDVRDKLAARYIEKPLAVLWNGAFHQHQDETQDEALARSYREMITSREKDYLTLADQSIPYEVQRGGSFSTDCLLQIIDVRQ